MSEIINYLEPFFEDCYRRISIREYAKLMRISPPTASKLLSKFHKQGLLVREPFRNLIFFCANKDSRDFIDLSRMHWRHMLKGAVAYLEENLSNPTIMLFGSLSKAEARKDSDVDLAVFAGERKVDLERFERKIKRKLQLFWFESIEDIRNKELANNILNGYVLLGGF